MSEREAPFRYSVPELVGYLLDKNNPGSLGANIYGRLPWPGMDSVRYISRILADQVDLGDYSAMQVIACFLHDEMYTKDGETLMVDLNFDLFVKLLSIGDPTLEKAFAGNETALRYALYALGEHEVLKCKLAVKEVKLGLVKREPVDIDLYGKRVALIKEVNEKLFITESFLTGQER